MGKRKFTLGRIRKNAERKRQAMKVNKPGRSSTKKVTPLNNDTTDLESNFLSGFIPPPLWDVRDTGDDYCNIFKMKESEENGVVVSFNVQISKCNMKWTISFFGKRILSDLPLFSKIPAVLNLSSLNTLLSLLNTCKICCGNHESYYVNMISQRKSQKCNRKSVTPYIDSSLPFTNSITKTVRSGSCHIITKSNQRCSECSKYRNTLRALYSKWKTANSPSKRLKRSEVNSRTNYRFLNTPERFERMKKLHAETIMLRKKIKNLRDKIISSIKLKGLSVSETLDADLRTIVNANNETVSEMYPENSFNHLFWKQQKEAMSLKNQNQMKWHPMMIKWCLHVHMLSSKSYNSLRETGVLKLPSDRTLRDYKNVIQPKTGLQPNVDSQLLKEINLQDDCDVKAYVTLVFDEIKIHEDLVFDKHSGSLIGFTDLTDINEHLTNFEQSLDGNNESSITSHLATHILVFMVRGVFSSFKFPYAQFPVITLTGEILYPIVWQCIERLELLGLKVLALACDGASSNRKFFKMHGKDVYKVKNVYASNERPLYFISDVPHLLKTVRNCWANSYSHSRSRQLWIKGFDISWLHLKELYDKHCLVRHNAPGLSILPKLKYDHLHLTSYSKMRVDLAAQVLSKTVAEAFYKEGNVKYQETEKFVRLFDKFFDCMNVRSMKECFYKRKPDLRPYRKINDSRLEWLENDFLNYLEEWEESVKEREGEYGKKERQTMMLSKETIFGLKLSVRSIVDLIRYSLKDITGVEYVLTEHFCQDPLESFFGCQRMSCGYSTNPTVKSFLHNTTSLRIQGSIGLLPFRGNCNREKRSNDIVVDETPLPKRRLQRGKKLVFESNC